MSIIPTNLAASLAGSQVERPEAREKERKEKVRQGTRAGGQRDADQVVVALEAAEAVRGLAGNTDEETREDRQARPQRPAPPHIDLEG